MNQITELTLPAAGALASERGAPASGHPDAELINLCQQHIANHIAYNTRVDDPSTERALGEAYDRTRDAIDNAKPRTFEGLAAKAQAAKNEATGPDGQFEGGRGDDWAWDLVNDIIRLSGATPTFPISADVHLIALCQEFIDLEKRFDEMVESSEDFLTDEAAAPIKQRQEAIAEEIAATPFKTMEGARMIARAAAYWAKDVIEDGFAELGGLHGDLYFTLVKGLIGESV